MTQNDRELWRGESWFLSWDPQTALGNVVTNIEGSCRDQEVTSRENIG